MANKNKKKNRRGGGVTISFDAAARNEFITGFSKRKQERREFGQAKAAEEKVQERKDIKDAHRADVIKGFKEAKRSRKLTERALDLMEAKATGMEIGPLPQGKEDTRTGAEKKDGEVSSDDEPEIAEALKPKSATEAIESSDEEGGAYTAFTQVNVDLNDWSLVTETVKPKKAKVVEQVEKARKIKKSHSGTKVKGAHAKIKMRCQKAKAAKAFSIPGANRKSARAKRQK